MVDVFAELKNVAIFQVENISVE